MRHTPEHGTCEKCHCTTEIFYHEDHDEYWCDNCFSNEAEAAYDLQQERNMESPPETSREEQIRTWTEHQLLHKRNP